MTIGERIRARRNELMMSQRDLCEKMGYSNHSTIGKIETNKVDIPQSRIVQFAEVLGVSVAYLMGWDETKKSAPIKESGMSEAKMKLFALADSCTEEEAERLLKLMELILEKQ